MGCPDFWMSTKVLRFWINWKCPTDPNKRTTKLNIKCYSFTKERFKHMFIDIKRFQHIFMDIKRFQHIFMNVYTCWKKNEKTYSSSTWVLNQQKCLDFPGRSQETLAPRAASRRSTCHVSHGRHGVSQASNTDHGNPKMKRAIVIILYNTLQGINISHLGKIIFKMPFLGDMLVPWRVSYIIVSYCFMFHFEVNVWFHVSCWWLILQGQLFGCSTFTVIRRLLNVTNGFSVYKK